MSVMKFTNVSILGLGAVDAPDVITSAEIEDTLRPVTDRLGVDAALLRELTGIHERRFWPAGTPTAEAAARAGDRALEDSGVDRADVGLLINTSVCQDFLEPSTASVVQKILKMPSSCMNFDLRNACLGFINAIQMAGNMIEQRQIEYALIVDGEQARPAVEATIKRMQRPDFTKQQYREQYATLTLGSGGVAMVLGRTDRAKKRAHMVTGSVSLTSSDHNHLCIGNMDEMRTDASGLLIAGLGLADRTWRLAQQELGWASTNIDEYVVHQVSELHTIRFADAMGADLERFHKVYPLFGNVGPAGVPFVLKKSFDAGRIRDGRRVALMGIGSGLNCAMMDVRW